MPDMAVECVENDAVIRGIRAVRLEEDKLLEDTEKTAQGISSVSPHLVPSLPAPSHVALDDYTQLTLISLQQPFSDKLSEEIFLHIASYLPQRYCIRAAQVNRKWRTVLHRTSHLWTEMYLHCNSGQDPVIQAQRIDNQIKFYEKRLPEDNARYLETLSVHLDEKLALPEIPENSLVLELRSGRHRFISKIRNISLTGWHIGCWIDELMIRTPTTPALPNLRCVRVTNRSITRWNEPLMIAILTKFTKLQALDVSDYSARDYLQWSPQFSPSTPAALHRLLVQPGMAFDGQENNHLNLEMLQHLEIGDASFSYMFTKSPLANLRTLSLTNTLFCPSFNGSSIRGFISDYESKLLELLNVQLEFPHLHTLKLIYVKDKWQDEEHRNWLKRRVRPTLLLCRMTAPNLRTLELQDFRDIEYGMSVQERRAWIGFCERHPLLEELSLPGTRIFGLEESLKLFPNLRKSPFVAWELPDEVLDKIYGCRPASKHPRE